MIKGITWAHIQSLESFRSFRGPQFCKPVTGQDFFCCFLQQTGSSRSFIDVHLLSSTQQMVEMNCRLGLCTFMKTIHFRVSTFACKCLHCSCLVHKTLSINVSKNENHTMIINIKSARNSFCNLVFQMWDPCHFWEDLFWDAFSWSDQNFKSRHKKLALFFI